MSIVNALACMYSRSLLQSNSLLQMKHLNP